MKKYTLTTEHSFDGAHFLEEHNGACANIHGHRWRIVMEVSGDTLQSDGSSRDMIMDFTDMKKEFRKLVDEFDHSFIVESYEYDKKRHSVEYDEVIIKTSRGDLINKKTRMIYIPFRPTAEKFSEYIYDVMSELGYPVYSITVYETPTNCCKYCPKR